MVQGCVPALPGYRNHGRQCRRWTDDIIEWTGMKINEAAAAAEEDIDRWKGILMEEGTERRRLLSGEQLLPRTTLPAKKVLLTITVRK